MQFHLLHVSDWSDRFNPLRPLPDVESKKLSKSQNLKVS